MAIDAAREPVSGATLYCNLEPCTNTIPNKKTPPCVERIIQEKIGRVVLANYDINPHVNGKGVALLRQHDIPVDLGILKDEASLLNEVYFTYIKNGRPFVHLKIAQTLDGRIATAQGSSKWITNEEALRRVHHLRAAYDAVLVGINTVLSDDPSLTVRLVEGKNPYRIILDDQLTIPEKAGIISDGMAQNTILFTRKTLKHPKAKMIVQRGIEVINIPSPGKKYLDLEMVLTNLAARQITSVLVEGGGEIFTSFIRARLYDKISFFIAPMLIGTGISSIGELGIKSLAEAHRLENVKIEIIDHQAFFQGYRDFKSIIA